MRKALVLSLLIWLLGVPAALAGSWSTGAPLQTGRAGLGVAVLNGKIYAAGGSGILMPLGDAEAYRPGGGGWRIDADLPVGLESFGLSMLNDKLYAVGGYAADTDGEPNARLWEYDQVNEDWVQGPSMPSPRAAFALIAAAGKLYALGGTGPDADKIFVFDPKSRKWSVLDQGLRDSRSLAAVAIGNKIYAIAGGPATNPVGAVNIFDTADGSWAEGPALPIARSGHAIAVLDGKIHVMGGRGGGRGESLNDHWVLDIATQQWVEAEHLPSPRTGAGAAAMGGAIYLIGGGAGGGFFAPFTAMTTTDVWRPDGDN